MDASPNTANPSNYVLPTIGGIFGRHDHDRFLLSNGSSQFDDFFPTSVYGKHRELFETGIDALASILIPYVERNSPLRLWTAENFCRESLGRLAIKLDHRIQYVTYQEESDLLKSDASDVVLYLHFNHYDPASRGFVERIKNSTGATVVEDFVHAPLEIAQFAGDFAINSLRKFSSLDLAVAYGTEFREPDDSESPYRRIRKEAEVARTQFLLTPSDDSEQHFLKLARDSEAALGVRERFSAHPVEIDRAIRFDWQTVYAHRRQNHNRLAQQLEASIPAVTVLPGNYMYVMIETSDRDRIRQGLFRQRIFPVIHWADSGSEQAKSLLSFHIDQRYTFEDLDRVAEAVKNVSQAIHT